MKKLMLIAAVAGLLGCAQRGESADGGGDAGSCTVAPTDNVGYQDCNTTTPDGSECVALCGRTPQDGSPGMLLAVGCTVQIGTSTPRTGVCVASCSECP